MTLIKLLHDITQSEYKVEFSNDFEGMITVTYIGEHLDWRHHEHVGYPGCTSDYLEEVLVKSLERFKVKYIGKL